MSHPTAGTAPTTTPTSFLLRFAWLSVFAALATVVIKGVAASLTGSVGLLSDAMESCVNLVAAVVALWALRLSDKPADHNHDFGHGKAEYVSSAVEGALIFVAAAAIIVSAIRRFLVPEPVEELGLGLALSVGASVLNGVVGLVLIRTGKKHRSITLEADGRHLLTDVITSVGVIVGIGLILLTGWQVLDPIVAIIVGLNILVTGYKLVRRSIVGLLDAALPPEEVAAIRGAIDQQGGQEVELVDLRTRESGRQRFVQATIVVPGDWTVQRSHDVADAVEDAVDRELPGTQTVVHIEPAPTSENVR
ncbi:cation diffusion facilitator family transporter [Nigerium massiliense]|uniref:cation diffusion facilitator family transporter n=1 Tax=Nigerium massiliense TaxID=1522317 RepID=UPI0006939575|nr:cation diffusion facilitator family transporter [Nigerium massiliense]